MDASSRLSYQDNYGYKYYLSYYDNSWTTYYYYTTYAATFKAVNHITSLSSITNAGGIYVLDNDVTASSSPSAFSGTFTGAFDGGLHTISGLTTPLFGTLSYATVCNVVLDNVAISNTGNTGAIACSATNYSRIYNCGVKKAANAATTPTISGTGYTGSIVGNLDSYSRVVNCYSFANITGGTTVGGIVGYNSYASTSSKMRTLVVNCMFYGNITGGTSVYPIYGGSNITNAGSTGINNYNYFRQAAAITPTGYNTALACEERFLRRWEFYRGILNSNRSLMAFYISGNVADTALLAKWVLNYGEAHYPILKRWGKYSSVINHFDAPTVTYSTNINYDEDAASLAAKMATHYCGAKMGDLSVTVVRGTGNGGSSTSQTITLPITDMNIDTANNHYDYCFRKVQLPYFNDYFADNYGAQVVTGWKITAVTGGVGSTYQVSTNSTTNDDGYNFADTLDTGKDLYGTSGRVFAQGGYYYVPQGVTAITIEAYWGNAVYLSDPNYDVVYNSDYATATNFTVAGTRPTPFNGQRVYTSVSAAVAAVPAGNTVYDNAIVLVGNCHQYSGSSAVFSNNNNRPFTVMSADLDHDDEPDFCLFYQHTDRQDVNPIRFDFLWQPGIGIAAKVSATGSVRMPDVGIFKPKGWFEVTETAVAHYNEFEYAASGSLIAPLILNNGIFEQFISRHDAGTVYTTPYIILGGNIWMKEFCNGTHGDNANKTYHRPISVMGDEYNKFYLTGTFRPDVAAVTDNAECYINGGKFGEVAGAGQEQLNGNVIFKVNHAIIEEFYGGGINGLKPVQGNIGVTMNNSRVGKYCGGPKFGNMVADKTVTTDATGSIFDEYYGAGNGGTSIYRHRTKNAYDQTTYRFDTWLSSYYRRGTYNSSYGVATGYEMEFFVWAGSGSNSRVGRFYVDYASFDKAQTNDVTSTLTRCLVNDDFYGGGNLGAVNGNVVSTLDQTVVRGSAFGAGFSAKIPTVEVYGTTGVTYPSCNDNTGLFSPAVLPNPTIYTWTETYGSTSSELTTNASGNWIYTASPLTGLGAVTGNVTITVKGAKNSHVYGSLYGGGNMSTVGGSTIVTTLDNTIIGKNVYGGGNSGAVDGSTHVQVGN
jgi:hypothetical protein